MKHRMEQGSSGNDDQNEHDLENVQPQQSVGCSHKRSWNSSCVNEGEPSGTSTCQQPFTSLNNTWQTYAQFKLAVANGNAQHITHLVNSGLVDVDYGFFPSYASAIHFAVESGNLDVFSTLLALGCSVNVKDVRGRTPLMIACELPDRQVFAHRLIKERANVNAKDELPGCGWTCLQRVAHRKDIMLLRALIKAGASIDDFNHNYHTALHVAIRVNWLEGAVCLLVHGARADMRDNQGWSALFYAACHIVSVSDRHSLISLMLVLQAAQLEYWATATNPHIILPVDPVTLSWLDTVRARLPLRLSVLSRNVLRACHNHATLTTILSTLLPADLYQFVLIKSSNLPMLIGAL